MEGLAENRAGHRVEHRFVHTPAADGELEFLERADLILLAGGDPAAGWRALEASGAAAVIAERYRAGAILVGISAGAVQLGQAWLGEGGELLPTVRPPALPDRRPRRARLEPPAQHPAPRAGGSSPAGLGGLGVPFGGAAVVAPDGEAALLAGLGKPLFSLASPALPRCTPALVFA